MSSSANHEEYEPTYRCMRSLMINMHKRPLDVWKHLDLVLQLLTDIVSLPKRRLSRHHDVNLDEVVWSALCDDSSVDAREWTSRVY